MISACQRSRVVAVFVWLTGSALFAQVQTITPDADPVTPQQSTGDRPAAGPVKRMIGPGNAPQPFPEAKTISQPTNDKELAAAIQKLGDELASSGRFSGSVLLAVEGKPLSDGAWGEADRSAKVRNTTDTAYDVGSIGKLFTQIAILQLAERGKLSLDDTIGKYLPDYPDKGIAAKVTIRELLQHSSGIPDFLSRVTPEMKIESIVDLKDFLPLFAQQPVEFEPGSANRYSNSGYIILGLVIEAISKENYRALCAAPHSRSCWYEALWFFRSNQFAALRCAQLRRFR